MTVENLFFDAVGAENILVNEPMSKHCSFKTGGNAQCFIIPQDACSLARAIKTANENNIPFVVIGNGSNLLISDNGLQGAVIYIGENFSKIEVRGTTITAGAGALLSHVAAAALENSLSGFEFASGIPGSFGGAIFMNAGAYGGEIKNVLTDVKVLTPDLEIKTMTAKELNLGYRTSAIAENGCIILEGTISLQQGVSEDIKGLMADLNGRRRDKQPLNFSSAGSTFKRPEGYFAGKLIEDCGLKGYTVGGAQVSQKHAGFVINIGNATTADILAVIEHCKKMVFEKFGILLQCEVRMLGKF